MRITKTGKIFNPDNYDIADMRSDDSTDDDSRPKKVIPGWARSKFQILNAHDWSWTCWSSTFSLFQVLIWKLHWSNKQNHSMVKRFFLRNFLESLIWTRYSKSSEPVLTSAPLVLFGKPPQLIICKFWYSFALSFPSELLACFFFFSLH